MAIGQRETGRIVIKDSRGPGGNRVACCTLRRACWKSSRDVVRYTPTKRLGALEIRLVATIAVRRTECVVVVHMAGGTGRRRRRHMRSGQSEPGSAVVKSCRCPTHRRMAHRTIRCRKLRARRGVHRIVRLLPGR